MNSGSETSSIGLLLRFLSQDWLGLLPDLYRTLRLWVKRYRHEGVYEILVRRVTARRIDATSICE